MTGIEQRGEFRGAFERIEGAADADVLLLCDHASNALPGEYGTLGLPQREFSRHIDRKSTRLNSSHWITSRMPSSA